MSKNTDTIAFALEILKLLAEKPRKRNDLAQLLSAFLDEHGLSSDDSDIVQKLTRMISRLRKCGFQIKSASHHPYELVESSFPVILSTEQRQALALAAYFLADMGFSAQAGQIIRIGNITETDQPPNIKVDFSPPVDYSEDKLDIIVRQLQARFQKQRRYSILYQKSHGKPVIRDLDRSELRLHNGILYLFAFVPDWRSWRFDYFPNVDQNGLFRVDRIISVGPATNVHWVSFDIPTLEIHYRMSGALASYQPRRKDERELGRDVEGKFVDIAIKEDCLFWFRQRILQYGANACILKPLWLAEQIRDEHQKAYMKYETLS